RALLRRLRSRMIVRRAMTSRWTILACLALAGAVHAQSDEGYPADISPPPGTRYPCALTALPRSLPGVPEGDRAYINRTYGRILRATQAKLVALQALETNQDVGAALARYADATAGLAAALRADTPPPGLGPFQDDVVEALVLQQAFFAEAGPL